MLTPAGHRAHRETNRRFEHANATFLAAFASPEAALRGMLQDAVAAATAARATVAAEARHSAS